MKREMMENYSRGYIQVDLDAIRNNMIHMKDNMSPAAQMIAVIKADGYGHGAVPVGKELETLEFVRGFAVATAEEAFLLRRKGIRKSIMLLGYTFPYAYEQLIREQIEITVFREDTIEQLAACAGALDGEVKVHVKVDTGMNRVGILPDDTGMVFIRKILETKNMKLEGIFTHFAKADESDKSYTRQQLRLFEDFVGRIEEELGYRIPIRHCSNSAGIIDMKEANMDAVRAGIALYGLWPSEEVGKTTVKLKPALSLHSHIVYVKEVETGTPISYGGTYVTCRKTVIATIPIGYGDGYPRSLSNKGYVLVKGRKAPIRGRVCMDQFMVDVTDIPGVEAGDPVTLIGEDHGERITVELLGDISGRFNYELVCNLNKRVPRVYTKDGAVISTKDYLQDF